MDDIKERIRRSLNVDGKNVLSIWTTGGDEDRDKRPSGVGLNAGPGIPARKRVPKTPLEGDIQSSVLSALRKHPGVAWVGRFNSGAYRTEYKGKKGFYKFNYMPKGLSMCDLAGMLKDGRFFGFEVKRPGWRGPSDEREQCQAAFLDLVVKHGGIGRFITCLDEALNAIGE